MNRCANKVIFGIRVRWKERGRVEEQDIKDNKGRPIAQCLSRSFLLQIIPMQHVHCNPYNVDY